MGQEEKPKFFTKSQFLLLDERAALYYAKFW
jgi:hypothetical protein